MTNLPQALKTVNFDGFPVAFTENGYLNATIVAKHYGKQVRDYLINARTQDYIRALDEYLSEAVKTASVENSDGGNLLSEQNQLVIVVKGGKPTEQGTWLHPKLAIDFARWLNPKFAVWCDMQIENMITTQNYTLIDQFNKAVLELEKATDLASQAGRMLNLAGKKFKPQAKQQVIELSVKINPLLPFVELGE